MARKLLSETDRIFAEYKRTAPRLDVEFYVKRAGLLPLQLVQAFAALHAACVRDEPAGRNHSKHKAEYRRLVDAVGTWKTQRDPRRFWVPLFTADELRAIDAEQRAARQPAYVMPCQRANQPDEQSAA